MDTLSLERLEIRKEVKNVTPATIIHCHKVALAFIGIGHLIVEKTQVDLSSAERRENTEREKAEIK